MTPKIKKSNLISAVGLLFTIAGWVISSMEEQAYYEEVKEEVEKSVLDKIRKY